MLAWFADAAPGARLMPVADALAAQRRGRSAPPPAPPRVASASAANAYFVALRLIEDDFWQATLRQTLSAYANSVDGEGNDGLGADLAFYERFALKPLASRLAEVAAGFGVDLSLTAAFFPWNRTFEIGLVASGNAAD